MQMKVSRLAEGIIGSEILKIAAEVKALIGQGEKIYNLTVGDFDSKVFPIPTELKQEIIKAYENDFTNYPAANGEKELRDVVSNLLKVRGNIDYSADDILVTSGARPILYSAFATLVDPQDTIIYAVPSWNTNHYTYLNSAKSVVIVGTPENNFMPSAADIQPSIQEASVVALCSPQNPTGTVFTKEGLEEICDVILAENKRRGADAKPVYLIFDQIYWELTMKGTEHYNPVVLRPEMRAYTVFVDGISKSLSATGVRVGWCYGPTYVINKMKSLLSHIGAWAPKPEQVATAKYLANLEVYGKFIDSQREKIYTRLSGLYAGFQELKKQGFDVDAVAPQAALYLTVKFALHGKTTANGKVLAETKDITSYLLNEAKIAVVPFYAFGADTNSPWYRISIGTCEVEDISQIIANLQAALEKLK
jgi:aspartate aminotransferase